MSQARTGRTVIVVGAGPVGSLAALYAAQRGDDVEVYELRGDLRDSSETPLNFTKSINLALSERGINAMRHANTPELVSSVLDETIPMHGRMIHGRSATGADTQAAQAYDIHGRAIRAVDRGGLNKRILDHLNKMPNVAFFYHHKLVGADFRNNKAWFEMKRSNESEEKEISFDLLIGADGAHSATRYHMMKYARVNYEQEYIDTLWCEFTIPPSATGNFRLSPNHLHVWPGGTFMFIAIASLDKSFTCTLFAPSAFFADIEASPETKLVQKFEENFPGVVHKLIEEAELVQQFKSNPHLPLINIKCSPHHFGSSAVIVGDAANAMVPFYGQGMNAGLESVRILFEHLDTHGVYSTSPAGGSSSSENFKVLCGEALAAYTKQRVPDTHAIADLALQNYVEMASSVRSPVYKLRKAVEEFLGKNFPKLGFATKYSRVSFGNERYSEVVKKERRQGLILTVLAGVAATGTTLQILLLLMAWWRRKGDHSPFLLRLKKLIRQ